MDDMVNTFPHIDKMLTNQCFDTYNVPYYHFFIAIYKQLY